MSITLLTASEIDHPYRVQGPVTMEEARRYCERLTKSHYENFLVAGVFCPRPLRRHFYNVYAYCRISDDLSDEIGDAQKSLILLDWWEDELNAMYSGAERLALSDKTCTALQLANFWQDVTRDLKKARVYIPLEDLDRFGYTVQSLCARRFTT